MTMTLWPMMERPREKLLSGGANQLSDAELLAVIIQNGRLGMTAVDVARKLLTRHGGLNGILTAPRADLCRQPGIGVSTFARFKAMQEFTQRQMLERIQSKDVLTSSVETRNYLRAKFRNCQREIFSCLFLDNQHHVMEAGRTIPGDYRWGGCVSTRGGKTLPLLQCGCCHLRSQSSLRYRRAEPGRYCHHP